MLNEPPSVIIKDVEQLNEGEFDRNILESNRSSIRKTWSSSRARYGQKSSDMSSASVSPRRSITPDNYLSKFAGSRENVVAIGFDEEDDFTSKPGFSKSEFNQKFTSTSRKIDGSTVAAANYYSSGQTGDLSDARKVYKLRENERILNLAANGSQGMNSNSIQFSKHMGVEGGKFASVNDSRGDTNMRTIQLNSKQIDDAQKFSTQLNEKTGASGVSEYSHGRKINVVDESALKNRGVQYGVGGRNINLEEQRVHMVSLGPSEYSKRLESHQKFGTNHSRNNMDGQLVYTIESVNEKSRIIPVQEQSTVDRLSSTRITRKEYNDFKSPVERGRELVIGSEKQSRTKSHSSGLRNNYSRLETNELASDVFTKKKSEHGETSTSNTENVSKIYLTNSGNEIVFSGSNSHIHKIAIDVVDVGNVKSQIIMDDAEIKKIPIFNPVTPPVVKERPIARPHPLPVVKEFPIPTLDPKSFPKFPNLEPIDLNINNNNDPINVSTTRPPKLMQTKRPTVSGPTTEKPSRKTNNWQSEFTREEDKKIQASRPTQTQNAGKKEDFDSIKINSNYDKPIIINTVIEEIKPSMKNITITDETYALQLSNIHDFDTQNTNELRIGYLPKRRNDFHWEGHMTAPNSAATHHTISKETTNIQRHNKSTKLRLSCEDGLNEIHTYYGTRNMQRYDQNANNFEMRTHHLDGKHQSNHFYKTDSAYHVGSPYETMYERGGAHTLTNGPYNHRIYSVDGANGLRKTTSDYEINNSYRGFRNTMSNRNYYQRGYFDYEKQRPYNYRKMEK